MSERAYLIGWWIQSEDEEIYGPVSRKTLREFLRDEVISRNTLVRHCTEETWRPAADVPGLLEGVEISEAAPVTGDRLADMWPSRRAEQQELAATGIECVRHRRPAVLVCVRCHAPYCRKCQMKPYRRPYYLCRRCQANMHNRRVGAFMLDSLLLYICSLLLVGGSAAVSVATDALGEAPVVVMQVIYWGLTIVFIVRDSLFFGAGPAKRLVGLRVVKASDGHTPLGHGQAVVRYLPFLIPFVPIIEIVVAYRDPLMRRWGDRWAKTRVIDSPAKLARVRDKTGRRLADKGNEPMFSDESLAKQATVDPFARFAE